MKGCAITHTLLFITVALNGDNVWKLRLYCFMH